MIAAFQGKSMHTVFIELIEHGLEQYECSLAHEPNAITKKALENTRNNKGFKKANTIKELFDTLDE